MPTLAGIDVRVLTGQDHYKFEEYGVRYIRGKTQVSAYIESQTGSRFVVGIKPHHPYHTYEKSSARTYSTKLPAAGRFDFLASIYIDGRAKPEMRRVIYLDPKHPKFDSGLVYLNGRLATDVNGNPIRQPWVFEDAWGLETVFGRMKVEEPRQGGAVARGKPGQIYIVLERINPVGAVTAYKPNPQDIEGKDSGVDRVDEDVTHTTGSVSPPLLSQSSFWSPYLTPRSRFGNAKAVDAPITGITSTYYQHGEAPYAVFEFFYRSAGKVIHITHTHTSTISLELTHSPLPVIEVLTRFPWHNLGARSGRPPVEMPQLSRLSLGSASTSNAASEKRGREDVSREDDKEDKEKDGKRARQ
ncbi:MAG: hypothetical protein Q9187_007979 [Circinaria calcarea]